MDHELNKQSAFDFDVPKRRVPVYWLHSLTLFAVCTIAAWSGTAPTKLHLFGPPSNTPIVNANEIDDALQSAATNALGQREGTIIVLDPQTGRVRAVVNPQIAFENSFAPGSTIKPFTALAALRAGLIDRNSRTLCREHYSHKDFATVCAHPRDLPPFNPSEAIAYSCNYYFGTLGERLNEDLLSETLSSFGFGKQAFINSEHDSTGQLLRGKNDPRNALGEGDYLQATPIQLILAYTALFNGGHLLAPAVAPLADFRVSRRAQLEIAAEHRAMIIEGLRGAVRYGTAARAGLNSSSLYVFGKTGTSTPAKGFRTQGWFVGFASDATNETLPSPEDINLAVLVFLKRAHGADAAALSRGIFEAYERLKLGQPTESERHPTAIADESKQGARPGGRAHDGSMTVRVHQVRENVTREMSLEDYVLGVVAAEGSSEDQPEALKALAVAARTYAVKNAGRHARDGFDFCTTTHCQRYQPVGSPTVREDPMRHGDPEALPNRPSPAGLPEWGPRGRVSAAVRATDGEILRDEKGQLVDSYFSASCGGMTANMQTLWGANAPAYLRGVPDEYCSTMPHHSWQDVISAEQLLQALHNDARTDPGASLKDLTVLRRDATGRAELIMIDGERRRTVSGWDFKIIVGRKLGWNLLKSSRFEVARSGANFIFRGSGFGHGLGLCQEGAHVMAQRGASYRQILGKYFPSTSVGSALEPRGTAAVPLRGDVFGFAAVPPRDDVFGFAAMPPPSAERLRLSGRGLFDFEATPPPRGVASVINKSNRSVRQSLSALCGGKAAKNDNQPWTFADVLWSTETLSASESTLAPPPRHHTTKRATLSSEHFRISYPARAPQRDIEGILQTLESTRSDLLHRISSAGLSLDQFPSLEIFIDDTTGDFVGRTGQPWWAAAATRGNRIELQPIEVLQRRGVLGTTLRHELVHPLIDALSHGRVPRWLAEGMALYLAGEGPMISRYAPRTKLTVEEIDQRLAKAASADQMRAAYAAAYREVSNLIKVEGEASIWRRVAGSSFSSHKRDRLGDGAAVATTSPLAARGISS